MGSLSIWHILILAVIVLLIFGGRGKISDLMGDVAKGIKNFRKGMNEPDDESPRVIGDNRDDTTVKKDQTTASR